jgi:hypothetical protein
VFSKRIFVWFLCRCILRFDKEMQTMLLQKIGWKMRQLRLFCLIRKKVRGFDSDIIMLAPVVLMLNGLLDAFLSLATRPGLKQLIF